MAMGGTPTPVLCCKLSLQEPGVCTSQWPWEALCCPGGPLGFCPPTLYLLQLETQLHHLSSTHQEASSENQKLREAERDLTGQLEEVREQLQVTREQLQVTRGHLNVAKGRVSWQMEEEPRQVAAIPRLR